MYHATLDTIVELHTIDEFHFQDCYFFISECLQNSEETSKCEKNFDFNKFFSGIFWANLPYTSQYYCGTSYDRLLSFQKFLFLYILSVYEATYFPYPIIYSSKTLTFHCRFKYNCRTCKNYIKSVDQYFFIEHGK